MNFRDYIDDPTPECRWSTGAEVKNILAYRKFGDEHQSGGLPIISDGTNGWCDISEQHTAIFGPSGYGKSVYGFMPLICNLADAGENLVVTDPKGELIQRTGAHLKAQGYRIYVINFRDLDGEAFNPLAEPYRLYRSGDKDTAQKMVNDFTAAIAAEDAAKNNDPFWAMSARMHLNGLIPFMFERFPKQSINLPTIFANSNDEQVSALEKFLSEHEAEQGVAYDSMRAVVSMPSRTRMSVIATLNTYIQEYIQSEKMAAMVSHSSFLLSDIAEPKTALFIISDDMSTTCNTIIGILLSQLMTVLVGIAFHNKSRALTTRVNFVLDEFASIPIPGVENGLATLRSRNIRFYLCIQSLAALCARYPDYKGMLVNCGSYIFLGSTEQELLELVSEMIGKSDNGEPLASIIQLETLKKGKQEKELLYLNLQHGVRYATTLPAFEKYPYDITRSQLCHKLYPPPAIYTIRELLKKETQRLPGDRENEAYDQDLAAKFDSLFDSMFGDS